MKKKRMMAAAFAASLAVCSASILSATPVSADEEPTTTTVTTTTDFFDNDDNTQTTTAVTSDTENPDETTTTTSVVSEIGTATLKGILGDGNAYQYFGEGDIQNTATITSSSATISGDGTYIASWEINGSGVDTISSLYLELDAFDQNYITTDTYPNLSIRVDAVSIDGTEVTNYQMSPASVDTAYYSDGKGSTRVYLTNNLSATPVTDLNPATKVTQKIEVTFTISGLTAITTTETTETKPSQIENNTYNSYNTYNNSSNGSAGSNGGSTVTSATQTADFSVGAVVIGAAAAISLAGAAFTITKRKKK